MDYYFHGLLLSSHDIPTVLFVDLHVAFWVFHYLNTCLIVCQFFDYFIYFCLFRGPHISRSEESRLWKSYGRRWVHGNKKAESSLLFMFGDINWLHLFIYNISWHWSGYFHHSLCRTALIWKLGLILKSLSWPILADNIF